MTLCHILPERSGQVNRITIFFYITSVWTLDVVWRICFEWWMIGTDEREGQGNLHCRHDLMIRIITNWKCILLADDLVLLTASLKCVFTWMLTKLESLSLSLCVYIYIYIYIYIYSSIMIPAFWNNGQVHYGCRTASLQGFFYLKK